MGPRDARPRIRATVDSPRIRSEKRPGTPANHAIGPPAGIRYLSKRACLALPDGSCVDRHHGDQRARGDRYLGRPGSLGGAGAQGHAAAHSARSARPSRGSCSARAASATCRRSSSRLRRGYGKTSLLAQWRRESLGNGAIVLWLTASPADDPRRLLRSLVVAFRAAACRPTFGHALLASAAARPGRGAHGMARRDRAVGARHRARPRRGRPPAAGVLRGARLPAAQPAPEPARPGRRCAARCRPASTTWSTTASARRSARPTCASTSTRRSSWSGSGSGPTSTRASPCGCTRWPTAGPSASSSSSR